MTSSTVGSLKALLDVAENPFGKHTTTASLNELEQRTNIWNAHINLTLVHQHAAWEKDVSAWGLLAGILSRVSSHIPPNVVLVDKHGRTGSTIRKGMSLNLPVVMTGRTGANKGALGKCVDEIITPFNEPTPGGTGQGLVKTWAEKKVLKEDASGNAMPPVDTLQWAQRCVVQDVNEFEFLQEEFARRGSQTKALLRSLTMGELAGMQNSEAARNMALPPHSYRWAPIWYTQPHALDTWIASYRGGDPQRALYAPVKEYRKDIPRPARKPQAITFPHPVISRTANVKWGGATNVYAGYPQPDVEVYNSPTVVAPVWVHWSPSMAADIEMMRRELDELDTEPYGFLDYDEETEQTDIGVSVRSHLILTTIKVAALLTFALGITDQRDNTFNVHISDVAWNVAKAMMELSQAELAGAFDTAKHEARKAAKAEGKQRGYVNHMTKTTQTELGYEEVEQSLDKVTGALIRLRAENPDKYHGKRDIQRRAKGTNAAGVADTLSNLIVPRDTAGVDVPIVFAEKDGASYRASDALMSSPAAQEYLKQMGLTWTAPVPRVDPEALFAARTNGAA